MTITLDDWDAENVTVQMDISASAVLKKIGDKQLIEEIRSRRLVNRINPIQHINIEGELLKRHLIDIVGLSYHTDNDTLINELKKKL